MENNLITEFEGLLSRIDGLEKNLANERMRINILTNQIDFLLKEKKPKEELATDLQINTLLNLGIDLPVKLTKLEASVLIKEALEKKEEEKLPESVQDDKMTPNLEHNDLYNEEGKYL